MIEPEKLRDHSKIIMQQMGQDINFLIPKHRKLAEDEIKQILEKYNISTTVKLPRIKQGDPAFESIEEEIVVGDVIEITRKSFAGESQYYRVVVE